MLNKLKKSNTKGFTIIEVMIVLAIAGLILLIVFLAVPALQRNARNTQRKSDASRLSSAVTDFVNDNNGTLPSVSTTATPSWATDCNTVVTDAGTLGAINQTLGCGASNGTSAPNAATTDKLTGGTGAITAAITPTKDSFVLDEDGACSTSGTTTGGSARQVAVLYTVESGSTYTWSCIQAE